MTKTKKKVTTKVTPKVTPKVTLKKPIPMLLGFFERIWMWLKDRIK
jgi:hypothetical protein